MSEEIGEVTETIQNLQDLYRKLSEYLVQSKKNPSDTDVSIKNLSFSLGKKDKEYSASMELDFSLAPKTRENKEKPAKPA